MKAERPIQAWQTPEAFLGKASLEQLMPYAKVGHFPSGSVVCNGDQWRECAYLVLKGECEIRQKSSNNGPISLQSFDTGETFGAASDSLSYPFGCEVVAVQDSVVLAIRADDLANLAGGDGDEEPAAPVKNGSPKTSFFFKGSGNRAVSFVFLSGALPGAMLSEEIARQVRRETDKAVVLVQFENEAVDDSVRYEDFDHELDGMASLPGEIFHDETGLHRLRLKISGDPPNPEVVGELIRKLRRRFHFVIVAVVAEQVPGPYLFRCVMRSDTTHFFVRPSVEDLYQLDLLAHELRPKLDEAAATGLKSVLCLANGEKVKNFDKWILDAGIASPLLVREYPLRAEIDEPAREDAASGLFKADIRRLARTIGDCQVGLVLSSGGAKGLAHIGVIQVLEENGIDVDVVAGASMGAYVGAIWAHGLEGGKLEELAREMEAKRAMWSLIDPVIVPWQGFMRGYAVRRRLERSIGTAQFADLARPLRVVAAQLDTMERVVFSTGEVAGAVHASIAVPGICIPVPINGEYYVDGGIVDPLPTDVLQEMGVSKIIAVNTIPTPERIRYCLQLAHELARRPSSKARSIIHKLLPTRLHANQYAHANILDILMHSTHGAQMRVAAASSLQADIVLHPDICDDRWLDFRNPGFYIRAGREIALRHLGEIKALIKKKGVSHEYRSPQNTLAEIV